MLRNENSGVESELSKTIRGIFSPILVYLRGITFMWRPSDFADLLKSSDHAISFLVKYVLGAMICVSLLSSILTNSNASALLGIPIFDEILMVIIYAAAGLLFSVVYYPALKTLGGEGNFRNTAISIVYVNISLTPIFIFIDLLDIIPSGSYLAIIIFGFAPAFYLAEFLKNIHSISYTRAVIVVLPVPMLVVFLSP